MTAISPTLAAALLFCGAHAARAQSRLDPIAEVGDPAGVAGGHLASISSVYVHPAGNVILDGKIAGGTVTPANDYTIWRGQPGALVLAAREGGPETFGTLTLAGISPADGVFFKTTENGTAEGGLYSQSSTLGKPGAAAPGTVQTFVGFGNFSANDLGGISFFARLSGPASSDSSIYTSVAGAPAPVALEAGPVAGIAGHVFLDLPRSGYLVHNELDTLAGYAGYMGPGRAGVRAGGLLLRDPGTGLWTAIANKRDPAPVPGGGSGFVFDTISGVTMNNSGELLFHAALLQGAPITVDNKDGIWHWSAGFLSAVVRSGDPAAGLPAGVDYDLFEEAFLDDAGRRIIVGRVQGAGISLANDRCVWVDDGTGLELILQEGVTPLRGGPGGIPLSPVQTIESVTVDPDGNIIVQASVASRRGVWRREAPAASPWKSVLTVGEVVEDTGGLIQTVKAVRVAKFFAFNLPQGGGPSGRMRCGLDDKIALIIEHSGGEGAYFLLPGPLPLEPIAVGCMDAPGVAGGIWDEILRDPVINLDDRVAFRALLENGPGGVTSLDDSGIWAQRADGSIFLAAREGSPANGAPVGAVFSNFPQPVAFNDNEQVCFEATMSGGAITADTATGLWRGAEGNLKLLAQSGVTVPPGLPAAIPLRAFFGLPVLFNDGTVFIRARLTPGSYPLLAGPGTTNVGSNSDIVVLRISNDPVPVMSVIAREGDPAPGGGLFGQIEQSSQMFGANLATPAVVFKAALASSLLRGIYVYHGGVLSRYVIEGDPLPAGGGVTFSDPGHPIMSDTGLITLSSTLSDSTQAVTAGVYNGTGAGSTLIARTGIPQSAATFGPVGVHPDAVWSAMNFAGVGDDGAIAFRATLQIGPGGVDINSNKGIWRIKDSTLSLVSRSGSDPTNSLGQPEPVSFPNLREFITPRLGLEGRTGYTAALVNGVFGLWVLDSNGKNRNLLYRGDLLTLPCSGASTRNANVFEIFYGNSHVISPSGPTPYRVFGTEATLVMTSFGVPGNVDGTSGLFIVRIP